MWRSASTSTCAPAQSLKSISTGCSFSELAATVPPQCPPRDPAMATVALGAAVAPGQCLGPLEDRLSGKGTYVLDDSMYATIAGEITTGQDGSWEVVPNGDESGHIVPDTGSVVVARVLRLSLERADCQVVAVGEMPLKEKFRGVVRKQDIRFFEIDKVTMTECFRVGDFIRAKVLALGDNKSYLLSTALSDNLGVIFAKSAVGAQLQPVSWEYMRCSKTGALEKRKVAKPEM